MIVYRYRLRPPTSGEAAVLDQFRAAHEYRNDLVAIERGRRHARRLVHETDAVREAVDVLKAATKSTRRAALRALSSARRAADADAPDEIARIEALGHDISRDARALTRCYWGTYLGIEDAASKARSAPLYGDDGLEPADPRFASWPGPHDATALRHPWMPELQLGVQVQKGMPVPDLLACDDTRVRLVIDQKWSHGGANGGQSRTEARGTLWMRVASEERDPVWATWPIRLHRPLPDSARIAWVRVSCRPEGTRRVWTAEFTLDVPDRTDWRLRDTSLSGAIAVELMWSPTDDGGMLAATWLDDAGRRGSIVIPERCVKAMRKPDGIRAVRDITRNDLLPKLAGAIKAAADAPQWLRAEANTMHLWKSGARLHRVADRWRKECGATAPEAYAMLHAWERRDLHLWQYEAHGRDNGLRTRQLLYRTVAKQLAQKYKAVIVPDRDLSREARWGPESDLRFTTSPQQLRDCLRATFGADCWEGDWLGAHGVSEDSEDEWKELMIERWRAGQLAPCARQTRLLSKHEKKPGGAWAERKAKKAAKLIAASAARNAAGIDAE